jgi:VCBS repeat protein
VLRNLGDGTFAAQVPYWVGHYPCSVTSADVDGDGWADLITANRDEDSVSVLRNLGDGTFAAQMPYWVGHGPYSVTSVDVDGDGWVDLVTANRDEDSVSVLRNLGDGTFAAQELYWVGHDPSSVTSADVDNDGCADLVTANREEDSVSVLRNLGDGTFAAQELYWVGHYPSSVTSGDVNGDGRMDVVTANYVGTMSVLFNRGTNPLGGYSYVEGLATASVLSPAAHDLTNAVSSVVLLDDSGPVARADFSAGPGNCDVGASSAGTIAASQRALGESEPRANVVAAHVDDTPEVRLTSKRRSRGWIHPMAPIRPPTDVPTQPGEYTLRDDAIWADDEADEVALLAILSVPEPV